MQRTGVQKHCNSQFTVHTIHQGEEIVYRLRFKVLRLMLVGGGGAYVYWRWKLFVWWNRENVVSLQRKTNDE